MEISEQSVDLSRPVSAVPSGGGVGHGGLMRAACDAVLCGLGFKRHLNLEAVVYRKTASLAKVKVAPSPFTSHAK
jgi:hypothetical protein